MNLLSAFWKQSSLKRCDLIFYGTGCCDMASKYKAVQSIGKKAIRDLPGPVFIDGFGNLQIKLDQYSQKFMPGWKYSNISSILQGINGSYIRRSDYSKYFNSDKLPQIPKFPSW